MIICTDAGIVPYPMGIKWQKDLAKKRRADLLPDQLLLLEHPPVFTMGRQNSSSDLLETPKFLKQHGMEIYKTDRGGRMTYHGPGQLVGYLIFRLRDSIPKLVWKIEEVMLQTLDHFRLEGRRDKANPGIWVDREKIAAVGLHIERGITRHGFALNVTCDLSPFRYIHPCGITDRGVTSLEKEVGWTPSMRDVKQQILANFTRVFRKNVAMTGDFPQIPE